MAPGSKFVALLVLLSPAARASITIQNCDADRIGFVEADLAMARGLVDFAWTYLHDRSFKDQRAYGAWFGYWAGGRPEVVGARVQNMDRGMWGDIIFDCGTRDEVCMPNPDAGWRGAIAYVELGSIGHTIYLCEPFFVSPDVGVQTQATIIAHEMSHFPDTAGTAECYLDPDMAELVAMYDPASAIGCANNYEYFVGTAALFSPVPPPPFPLSAKGKSSCSVAPGAGGAVVPLLLLWGIWAGSGGVLTRHARAQRRRQ